MNVEEIFAAVLRVARRVPDPELRAEERDPIQQLREVDGVAVRVHAVRVDVLAEDRHLLVAGVDQLADLVQDAGDGAAPLAAPRERHDAEGAHVVAPAHDRDERAHAVRVVADGREVGVGLFARELDVDGGLAGVAALGE